MLEKQDIKIQSLYFTAYNFILPGSILLILTGINVCSANINPYADLENYLIFCGSGVLLTSIIGVIGGLRGSWASIYVNYALIMLAQGLEIIIVVTVLCRRFYENPNDEALHYSIMMDPAFVITVAVGGVFITQCLAQISLSKLAIILQGMEEQKIDSVEQRDASKENPLLGSALQYSNTPLLNV